MKTITHECYVSLEVAKLLKEAGFDWECNRHYTEGRNILFERAEKGSVVITRNQPEYPSLYFAPTLDVAQRWLREVMNVPICASITAKGIYTVEIYTKINGYWCPTNALHNGLEYENFDTYEEALEAGIQKCLTILLEQNKNNE